MDQRYDLLKKARCRNIKEYNDKYRARKLNPENGHAFMPYIVLVIDEFADLIMTAGKEIEMPIGRLAQLARAVGIHLIIATQRPSVKIITGLIKANFPARIAFRVTSNVDSRTILDCGGAEQLIGRGDMLLSVGSDIIRLQCAFVDTPEVERVVEHIRAQRGFSTPYYLPEYQGEDGEGGSNTIRWSDLDEMFEEAARLVVQSQHGSTSMLQRRLQLGYNRAGRIMDQLESAGVVGAAEGSKPREVLVMSDMELTQMIDHLRDNSL
jgi:S-DNA-T family DNA segregation ATPase FtsK/SpoIIIE